MYVSSGLLLCDVCLYIASSCGGVDLVSLCGNCRHKRALSKQGVQVYTVLAPKRLECVRFQFYVIFSVILRTN